MLNKKEKTILTISFITIILGGVTYFNKEKFAENMSSNHILNTIYKNNNYKKFKNEIYRKINDKDFREIVDDLSFEKLEVTNDILKDSTVISAINSSDTEKKNYLKDVFSSNLNYEKAQNLYKVINGFNSLETISNEFSIYFKDKFNYSKENFNQTNIKELPNNILQRDKLIKLTVNENLKNIIKNLSYEDINLISSLVEKNPAFVRVLEKPFITKDNEETLFGKHIDENYFSLNLDYKTMEDIFNISENIVTIGNSNEILKNFFSENFKDFDYNKIATYGGLYLSDKKNDMKIAKEFSEDYYTFENPYIKLNPYERTPLGALVNFNTAYNNNPIKITIKGVDNNPDYSYTLDKKSKEGIPVIALYPNTDNKVNIKILSEDKKSVISEKNISIKTENLDDRLPVVVIEKDYEEIFPGILEPGMNTASFITNNESLPFIFDNYGKIRYVFDCGNSLGKIIMRKNKNGNWVWDNGKTTLKVDSLGKVSGEKIEVNDYKELKIDNDLTKGYTVNHIQTLPKKNNLLIVYGFSNTTYSSAVFSEINAKTREEYFKARIYFNKNTIEENNIIFGERTIISPTTL